MIIRHFFHSIPPFLTHLYIIAQMQVNFQDEWKIQAIHTFAHHNLHSQRS